MGRYHFFLNSFGIANDYVYATSILNNDIYRGIDINSVKTSDSSDSPQNIVDIDTDSSRTSKNAENSEESSEKSSASDIGQYEYIEPSSDLKKSSFWEDESLFEDGYEKKKINPFGVWGGTFFARVHNGGEIGDWIGAAFDGYRYAAPDPYSRINLLTRATQNSVWATNARIDDRKHEIDTINSKLGTYGTNITNAFKRIANSETNISILTNKINGEISTRQNAVSDLWLSLNNEISNRRKAITDVTTKADNINSALQTEIATRRKAITDVTTKADNINSALQTEIATRRKAITDVTDKADGINSALQNEIATRRKAITDVTDKADGINSALQAEIDTRRLAITDVTIKADNINSALQTEIATRRKAITDVTDKADGINSALQAEINTRRLAITDVTTKANNINSALQTEIATRRKAITDVTDKADGINSALQAEIDTRRLAITDVTTKADNINSALQTEIATRRKAITDVADKADGINSALQAEIDTRRLAITDVTIKADNINSALQTEITTRRLAVTDIWLAINDIKNQINGFAWSDVGIIASILDLKNSNNNLFKSSDYSATVVAGDGMAVKLIKYQFAMLKSAIVDTLNSNQKNTQFLFDKYFGLQAGSAIYALRYTMVDGYKQTNDLLQHIFDGLNLLGKGQNTSNGWLELIHKGITDLKTTTNVITQWLKLIYEKNIIISIPAFDYNRLQNMLDGLNFGKIVNEAGTNMWDFLKSLIETLGDIITTGLTEISGLAQKILDILSGLIDDVIGLIVPKNLDFLDDGFQGTSSKIKLKFNFLFNWVDSFKSLLSGQVDFQDFDLSLGFFEGNVNVPLSVINNFAPFVKVVVTGFILLEFLIDMYKWFHTKGEVIE
ncbi:hypothetical protein IGI37_001664 [Enterococcus sp. AZ194]|uniref:hypothetical protein n=1 Tax=Enterococcus sp. AZ194 TaxID=2774629 RepID=UPI003F29DB07